MLKKSDLDKFEKFLKKSFRTVPRKIKLPLKIEREDGAVVILDRDGNPTMFCPEEVLEKILNYKA